VENILNNEKKITSTRNNTNIRKWHAQNENCNDDAIPLD
jgi:hypothetical protein